MIIRENKMINVERPVRTIFATNQIRNETNERLCATVKTRAFIDPKSGIDELEFAELLIKIMFNDPDGEFELARIRVTDTELYMASGKGIRREADVVVHPTMYNTLLSYPTIYEAVTSPGDNIGLLHHIILTIMINSEEIIDKDKERVNEGDFADLSKNIEQLISQFPGKYCDAAFTVTPNHINNNAAALFLSSRSRSSNYPI